MKYTQPDLFAQDNAARNSLSQSQRTAIRERLEATIAKLEATETFPWRDPLDAVHLDNRFERDSKLLGDEGALLWARYDKEMERLHATQFDQESGDSAGGAAT